MSTLKYRINYSNHSEEAIQQVLDTFPGKPVMRDDEVIATIVSAEIVEDSVIEFTCELKN